MIWHIGHYTQGPNWVAGQPICDQPLTEHVQYLHGLHATGYIVMAGPFEDSSGGVVVFATDDRKEVERVVSADPAVLDGTLVATVKPWIRVI